METSTGGSPMGRRPPGHSGAAIALVAITLIGLGLRVAQLPRESAWWDEVASLKWLNAPSVNEFLRLERVEDPAMPPVYFLLEYFWSRWVGRSVLHLRLLSVFLGLLALQMTYLLARKLFGTGAGLVASLALALSMVHIYYSQEVRVYALVPLLALCSMHSFVHVVDRGPTRWWFLHVVANAALAFTHAFAVLLFAAQWGFLVLFRKGAPRMILGWTAAHVPIAALVWIWWSTVDQSNVSGVTSWIVMPGIREIGMMFLVFCGGRASNENPARHLPTGLSLDWLLATVLAGVIAWFVLKTLRWRAGESTDAPGDERRRKAEAVGLLILWLLVPPLILCVVSFLWRPCFVYRYVLHSSLPLYLLLGGAFSALRSRRARTVIASILLLLSGYQLSALAVGPFRPDWQGVSRYLESRVTPNDLVLVFQDINLAALAFNSTLPPSQMQHVRVWSEVCGPVLDAHAQGRDIWFIVWLWSDPANMESCFTSNQLSFATRDFPGWPNLRLYHLPSARRS